VSKTTSKPISRKEQDQMKRNKMNNKNPSPDNKSMDNKSIIEKCKKLLTKKNSEN